MKQTESGVYQLGSVSELENVPIGGAILVHPIGLAFRTGHYNGDVRLESFVSQEVVDGKRTMLISNFDNMSASFGEVVVRDGIQRFVKEDYLDDLNTKSSLKELADKRQI